LQAISAHLNSKEELRITKQSLLKPPSKHDVVRTSAYPETLVWGRMWEKVGVKNASSYDIETTLEKVGAYITGFTIKNKFKK